MAKFYGVVGFAITNEVGGNTGIWEDTIIERPYYGDVLKSMSRWQSSSDKLLDNIEVSNRISILADAYANEYCFAMRYIKWNGVSWVIQSVEIERPRLILTIGGVYNGPEATITN